MARLPRVYIEGILYYVTSRGGHNQNVFRTHADYLEYMGLISKYKKQYDFKLFAFVLLPTHLHMLFELRNNAGLSSIMHDINSLYTKIFNSKYNTKGHLFEARYKAALANKESCLLDLVRHIHRNPKRERIVYDSKDYPYSSHIRYLDSQKRVEPDMGEEVEEVFRALKGREEAFADFVKNTSKKEANEIKRRLKKRVLGPAPFRERVKRIIEKSSYETRPAKRLKRMHRAYALSAAAVLIAVSTAFGYFARRHARIVTEYDNTIALYERTVEGLKAGRQKALRVDEDAESYAWKIRVAEESLSGIRRERSRAIEMAKNIENSSWRVRLRQIGGPRETLTEVDRLSFGGRRVSSEYLADRGYAASNYSVRLGGDGGLVWETIQNNSRGDTASWKGKLEGETLRGVLSLRSAEGVSRDFSFISDNGLNGRGPERSRP